VRYRISGQRSASQKALIGRSPSLTRDLKDNSDWTEVSHLQQNIPRLEPPTPALLVNSDRETWMPSRIRSAGRPSAQSPTPTVDPADRTWHNTVFSEFQPAGRGDAKRLREWLELSLGALSSKGLEDLYSFSEEALSLYNMAFQELTRQVSVQCVERGRLMSDVWTSHSELTGRLLTDLVNHKSSSDMAVAALQKEKCEMQSEIHGLRVKLRIKEAEHRENLRRLRSLEELSVKHMYKGDSWLDQELEWQQLEAASHGKYAGGEAKAASRISEKQGSGQMTGSFWINALKKRAESREGGH